MPNQLDLRELARDIGTSMKRLAVDLDDFNKSLKAPEKKHNTKNWIKNEAIPLSSAGGRNFAPAFVKYLATKYESKSDEIRPYIVSVRSATGVAARKPTRKINTDISEFAEKLHNIEKTNNQLRDSREELAGYYYLIRKPTGGASDYFLFEPLLIGEAKDESWILSQKRGVMTGWSFVATDLLFVNLRHQSNSKVVGFRSLYVEIPERLSSQVFRGILLRLSDDVSKPVATRVLLVRAALTKEEEVLWLRCRETPNDADLKDAVRRVGDTSLTDDSDDEERTEKAWFDYLTAQGVGQQSASWPDDPNWHEDAERDLGSLRNGVEAPVLVRETKENKGDDDDAE